MDSLKCIEENLVLINQNIKKSYDAITNNTSKFPILVAVSKIQPKKYIIEAYRCGHRHFGENYIQELYDKATDSEEKCPDIKWHLIGHIQTNKINKLLDIPNLYMIQTVDSQKLAQALDTHIERHQKIKKINVLVQVNTSSEEAKSGVSPENTIDLVKYIINNCTRLRFCGLMTIGAYGYDCSLGPNPDFLKLLKVKNDLCEKMSFPQETQFDISMGMSTDYEHAVTLGSSIVRVGTAIFGERKYNISK